ncbi:membrane protein [Mycobacterium phage Tyson]|nr:membrane protein [Mycobacterium phage Tyson]
MPLAVRGRPWLRPRLARCLAGALLAALFGPACPVCPVRPVSVCVRCVRGAAVRCGVCSAVCVVRCVCGAQYGAIAGP